MSKTGPRPHVWKAGPDPIDRRLYIDCQRARAQAWYRGEQWFITEQEYIDLWRMEDRYLRKGKTKDCVCMTKRDHDQPWTVDNVEFVDRSQHFQQTHWHKKRGTKRMREQKLKESQDV